MQYRPRAIIPMLCSGSLIKTLTIAQAAAPFSAFAIAPHFGTQGIGAEISTPLLPDYLNLTAGYSRFGLNYRSAYGGQRYSVDIRLGGAPTYLSLYPLGPDFHLDAGMIINQNRIGTSAFAAAGGVYFYKGHHYVEKKLGPVRGSTHFDAVVSYFGVGLGNPFFGSRWTLMVGAGVILEGGDHARLSARGENEVPGARQNIETHQSTFRRSVAFLDAFPMVSIGFGYRF
jgi:hypothetical protein